MAGSFTRKIFARKPRSRWTLNCRRSSTNHPKRLLEAFSRQDHQIELGSQTHSFAPLVV
jgi:hypothetical protein